MMSIALFNKRVIEAAQSSFHSIMLAKLQNTLMKGSWNFFIYVFIEDQM